MAVRINKLQLNCSVLINAVFLNLQPRVILSRLTCETLLHFISVIYLFYYLIRVSIDFYLFKENYITKYIPEKLHKMTHSLCRVQFRHTFHYMDSFTTIKRGLFLVSMVVWAKNWQKLAIIIKVDLKVPLKKKSVSLIFDLFLEK